MLRRHRLVALLLGTALALSSLACSESDGRTLPPVDPDRTTTTPSAPDLPPSTELGFTLLSPSFLDGGPLPVDFTCQGERRSPDLAWSSVPVGTLQLALVVRDLNAAGFVHWVVGGLDPTLLGFGAGGLPEGAVEGMNSAGSVGWTPACPPSGSGTHTYELTLHALSVALTVDPSVPAEDMARQVEEASIGRAVITAVYPPEATAGTTAATIG